MGYLEQMIDEENCIEVYFKQYIELRSNNKIFLFFEGKDDFNYYLGRMSLLICDMKYEKFDCNCKKNVLDLYSMIINNASRDEQEIKLFFVDKDFDLDNNFSDDIYVTPTYSIENFYISDTAFKNMIMGVWGLSGKLSEDDESDMNKAMTFLISKRNEIINSMMYANAWYSLQRKKTLSDRPIPKLTAIKKYDEIKNIASRQLLESKVPNYISVSDEEIEEEINRLKKSPVECLRGKYFVQIMPKYIMQLFNECNKKKGYSQFSKRHSVKVQVCEDNMVYVLNAYADVPKCLNTYLLAKLSRLNVS